DSAAPLGSGITDDDGIGEQQRTGIVDAAAKAAAAGDANDRVVADDATHHRHAASIVVVDAAAALSSGITADGTVTERSLAFIIYATTNGIATVAHGKAGNGDNIRLDVKDAKVRRATGGAPLDGQVICPRPRDGQVLVDEQFTTGQRNRPAYRELNRLARRGDDDGFTQRAGAAVGGGCDCGGPPGVREED